MDDTVMWTCDLCGYHQEESMGSIKFMDAMHQWNTLDLNVLDGNDRVQLHTISVCVYCQTKLYYRDLPKDW